VTDDIVVRLRDIVDRLAKVQISYAGPTFAVPVDDALEVVDQLCAKGWPLHQIEALLVASRQMSPAEFSVFRAALADRRG
jgi:hypothetical protein